MKQNLLIALSHISVLYSMFTRSTHIAPKKQGGILYWMFLKKYPLQINPTAFKNETATNLLTFFLKFLHMLYEQSFMNGKFYLAGTETSPFFGGYMDGAVYSAVHAAENIIQCINK